MTFKIKDFHLLPRIRFTGILLASQCIVAVIGCGGAPSKTFDAAQQATISGKVTLDGSKPIPLDSTVAFYCAEKAATGAGKVDALGSYSIKAQDKIIGLPAGRYQVTVRPAEAPPAQVGTDDYKKMMMQSGSTAKAEVKSDIPTQFHAIDTTKIVLEVKPGANTIDLDLSKF